MEELSNFELEAIMQSVRSERKRVEKDFTEAIKISQEKHRETEYVVYGVAETLELLQKFNNLIIKIENELERRRRCG